MNSVPKEKKNTTVHEEAIIEILDATKHLTVNKTLVINLFQSAGIIIDDRLSLVSLAGNAESRLNSLMNKLSPLHVVKMMAKRILWNRGLKGGQSGYFLGSLSTQMRTSWLARRAG